MWFGIIGGVSIFDGKNWHKLTEKDDLVDNRVYSMMIDSQKKCGSAHTLMLAFAAVLASPGTKEPRACLIGY